MAFDLGNGIGNFHNMINNVQQSDSVNAAQEMLNSRWATQTGDRATQDADIMRNCQ
jgi:lysozyme